MIAYIIRRLLYAIPILIGVNVITFGLFFMVNTPDDMARMQLGVKRVTPEAIVDPTGCGDAYRAGLLYGIGQGFDWATTGRLASVMGSLKIASRGGQNHLVTRERVATVYRQAFGSQPW